METSFLQSIQQIHVPLKQDAATQSYVGDFPNSEEEKETESQPTSSQNNPQPTFKVSAEEINSLFFQGVFSQAKGSPPAGSNCTSSSPTNSTAHQCTVCGRLFPYRYQLIVHSRYHTLPDGLKLNVEGEERLASWPVSAPAALVSPKLDKLQYPCHFCQKCFSRKEHLSSHMTKHTGENLHECHLCSRSFSRKDHLENHVRAHENDFKCHVCLKIFTRKEHLVNHIQWHDGTSPHKCQLCSKIFTRKEHLVNHVRQHTGESPHVCRYCAKAFTRKEHVENHERAHTGETPFKCRECGRAFSRRDHLVSHERSHINISPFKCFPCNKHFTKREHLASHQRHHHTVRAKPKKRGKGKGFSGGGSAGGAGEGPQGHGPQETGPKPGHPYVCQICYKSFPLKGNLIFHMNTHSVHF